MKPIDEIFGQLNTSIRRDLIKFFLSSIFALLLLPSLSESYEDSIICFTATNIKSVFNLFNSIMFVSFIDFGNFVKFWTP